MLVFIFILALILRFLYFPDNVNFAYDQARDFFASLEVLTGDFKVIGPPTTASDKIFHGAAVYYIWAPILFLSNHSPESVAAVIKVFNAVGVFLVFLIGKKIFNKTVGLLSAFLYAVSFEQTQYSLFLGHPSFGVIAVLIFYFGLTLWIFNKQKIGFIVTLLGLGLALQFEDANILLLAVFGLILILFRKSFNVINLKTFTLGILVFILSILTFVLAEFKYQFRMSRAAVKIFQSGQGLKFNTENYLNSIIRFVHDNIFFYDDLAVAIAMILLAVWLWLLFQDKQRNIFIFLGVWFFGGLLAHLINNSFSYYFTPAATVSLLIFISFLIYKILNYQKVGFLILALIVASNVYLIISENFKGSNSDIVIQPGMLTQNQKKVLDYIYQKANSNQFSVLAITIPLDVNTTWSYLFEWYGRQKYGYLPVWGSETASGFYGNLKVETVRSNLPQSRFLIIEPTVGIDDYIVADRIKNENYFSKVVEEKKFGTITVQQRQQI